MMKARFLGERLVDLLREYRTFILYIFILCGLAYLICFLFSFIVVIIYFFYNVYMLCDKLLYSPTYPPDSRIKVDTPEKYTKDYEYSYFVTEDKISLNYIFLRKASIDVRLHVPTIVFLHGNAGNIGHRLDNALQMYEYLNVNILLLEYRGYGFSKGKPSENGLLLDTIAALKFLHTRNDINPHMILLFGRSLGGAVAVGSIHLILNTPCYKSLLPAALIIENTFTSVPDIARKMSYEQMNPFIAWLIHLLPGWFYKSRFNSLYKIADLDLPILFISGLKDELLPASMMEDLYNAVKSSSKHILHFTSGTHNYTWRCTNYYLSIEQFLVALVNEKFINKNIPLTPFVSITINDFERSPLIDNEESEWRSLCNTDKL